MNIISWNNYLIELFRNFYTSSSSGKRSKRSRTNLSIKAQKTLQVQQQKEEEYNRNCEMVDNFNELLDIIRSIHEECSEIIDWPSLRDKPEPLIVCFQGLVKRKL